MIQYVGIFIVAPTSQEGAKVMAQPDLVRASRDRFGSAAELLDRVLSSFKVKQNLEIIDNA